MAKSGTVAPHWHWFLLPLDQYFSDLTRHTTHRHQPTTIHTSITIDIDMLQPASMQLQMHAVHSL
jgi:hypothetical protein